MNYFVGYQLGTCQNFLLDKEGPLNVKVQHSGNDGGKIQDLILWTSHRSLGVSFQCDIGKKLDHDESVSVDCIKTRAEPYKDLDKTCNGDERFCKMKFNKFTFPGTHNSGTGMKSVTNKCLVKNQDFSMTEMLDFGIRFFDFDTKYKSDGKLETGHNVVSWVKFGEVKNALIEIKDWLNKHPNEIVVPYFGNMVGNITEGQKELRDMLVTVFTGKRIKNGQL